jgi:hypothetical protein
MLTLWDHVQVKLRLAGLAVLTLVCLASCGGSPKGLVLDGKVGLVSACSLLTAEEAGAILLDVRKSVSEHHMHLGPRSPRHTSGCGYNGAGDGTLGGMWIQLSHGQSSVKAFEATDWGHDNPPARRLTVDGTTAYWFGGYLTATKDGYVLDVKATPWNLGQDRSAMTLALPRLHDANN